MAQFPFRVLPFACTSGKTRPVPWLSWKQKKPPLEEEPYLLDFDDLSREIVYT